MFFNDEGSEDGGTALRLNETGAAAFGVVSMVVSALVLGIGARQ